MPLQSPAELSIGIDFGTSNTVVAIAGPDGSAEAIVFDPSSAGALVGTISPIARSDERAVRPD